MTPEADAYLAKAREDLAEAHAILGIGLAKAAALSAPITTGPTQMISTV